MVLSRLPRPSDGCLAGAPCWPLPWPAPFPVAPRGIGAGWEAGLVTKGREWTGRWSSPEPPFGLPSAECPRDTEPAEGGSVRERRASPAFQSRPIARTRRGGSTRVRAGIGRPGASCTLPSVPVPAWSLDRGRVLCSEPAPGAGVRAGELPRRPGCSSGDRVSWGGSCSNRGAGATPPTPLVSGAPSLWLLAPGLLCVGAEAPVSHPACSGFLGLLASMSLSVKWAQGSLQGGQRCQRQLVGGTEPGVFCWLSASCSHP